jgi:type I restriction enzyme, S subunit
MGAIEKLITENLPIWSSSVQAKSTQGRGSSSKRNLYGVKKLRELILDLAVRGLLVPQDSNDEPASVLLEKIAEEKEQLIKLGAIKKQKPLTDITMEKKSGKLVDGWEWVKLGNLVYLEMGQSPPSKFYNQNKDGLPFFQGKADFGAKYPTARYWCTQPNKYAYPNDILLSVRAPVGPTNIANIECCIGRGLAALRPLGNTPANFIDYLIKGFRKKLESNANGTTFAAVSKKDVENLIIPLPPLVEQHRIVAKVDELMSLCDTLEQQQEDSIKAHETLVETLIGALTKAPDADAFQSAWQRVSKHFDMLLTTEHSVDKLKETILQLAVMGKLVPQDPNDEPASALLEKIAAEKEKLIKDGKIKKQKKLSRVIDQPNSKIPQNWVWCRLSNIALFENGDRSSRYPNASDLVTKGIPFFGAPDIVDRKLKITPDLRFISEEKFKALSNGKLMDKDFVMLLRGSVGKTAQFNSTEQFATGFINAQMLIIRLLSTAMDGYVNYYFYSKGFLKEISDEKSGAVIKQIPAGKIADIKIAIPPLAEQHRIVAKVDELMALCDDLKQQLNDTQTTQMQLTDAVTEQAVN